MTGSERYTFDTNLLFYALDPDAGSKHAAARRLLASASQRNAVLLLQTLGELANAVKRKNPGLIHQSHRFIAASLELFEVVSATPGDLVEALAAHRDHKIPFWDAMLWASARRAGCTLFLTEDLQDERTLGGVMFRNPFLFTPAELDSITD